MKPQWKSRTNRVGILLIVGGVAMETIPQLAAQGVTIPPWVLTVIGAVMVALRQVTTQPVGQLEEE